MKMTATAALDHLAETIDAKRAKEGRHELQAQLAALVSALDDDDLDDEATPGAVWSALDYIRRWADEAEADMIERLREGRTWQEVADLSGGRYVSRQGAQRRHKELTSLGRRTTSGLMRRGAAVSGRRSAELPAAPISDQVELI